MENKTKQEATGKRPSVFSGWTRTVPELSSYSGYRRYDIDGVWWNKINKFIMLIEEKCGSSVLTPDQGMTYDILEEALEDWCIKHNWTWKGKHLLRFKKYDLSDIELDDKPIDVKGLIDFLI